MSSKNITQCSKERFSRVLCQTCSSHRILPASYSVPDVMSIELHKTGSFADIYKGQHEENPVRLKVLRKQTERNMELIKSVCVIISAHEKPIPIFLPTEALLRDCCVEIHFASARVTLPRDMGKTTPVLYRQPLDAKWEYCRIYRASSGYQSTSASEWHGHARVADLIIQSIARAVSLWPPVPPLNRHSSQ